MGEFAPAIFTSERHFLIRLTSAGRELQVGSLTAPTRARPLAGVFALFPCHQLVTWTHSLIVICLEDERTKRQTGVRCAHGNHDPKYAWHTTDGLRPEKVILTEVTLPK